MSFTGPSLFLRPSLFLLCVSFSFTTVAQITSTFSSNDEGWKVADESNTTPQTVTYHATGGNPGGYVSTSIATCCSYYWKAPAKFLGGHCLDSYGMNLKFDLQLAAAGSITIGSSGSLRLTNSANYSIIVNLAPVPAVTPGWTSYTIKLDETTAWKNNNTFGPLSTHAEILNVLSDLAKIEIVAQSSNGPDPEVSIDNVSLEQRTLGTPPTITSFSPQNGIPAFTDVTITGSNFNTTAANNAVYFGGVKANVTSASATQLVVKVPAGAQYAPIIVFDKTTGLSASTVIPFLPRFNNNEDHSGQIIRASMGPMVSFDLDGTGGWVELGDIDGDGLQDIIAGEGSMTKFDVFRNAGVTGSITTASFDPKISVDVTESYSKAFVTVADFDGDGKLDVAVSSASTFYASVSVFRNTSTPGTISFAAPFVFTGLSYSDGPLTVADMDGDGRPELLVVFNNNCATGDRLYIYPNRSTPGSIDFCAYETFGPVTTCGGSIVVGDLNGDKLPEVIVEAGTVTVFENTSTKGDVEMATPFVLSTTGVGKSVIADLDGDGKQDIAFPYSTSNIDVRRNIYSGGVFDAAAFAASVIVKTTVGLHGGSEVVASDINGDGKLDLVVNGHTDLAILQNVSTPGTLTTASFLDGTPYRGGGTYSYPVSVRVGDFDGDNKPDAVMKTSNTTPSKLLVFHNECFPVPRIDSFTPASGTSGSNVTFTGDYFKTGITSAASLRVGVLQSPVGVASNTSASASVPSGSQSSRISFTEHGLTSFSKFFPVTFNTNRIIDATSFADNTSFALGINTRDALEIADFDDDGKVDVAIIENYSTTRIFRNTQVTAGQPITTATLTPETTTYTGGYNLIPLDIDGDGKTDLNNGYGLLKNNGSSGTISFLYGPNGAYTYSGGFNYVAPGDFNKDGKTDLAVTNGTAFVQLYQNESTTEPFVNDNYHSTFNINAVNLVKPDNYGGIVAADFDGDGYDDLASTNDQTDNFTVYENLAVYGDLSTASFSAGVNMATGSRPFSLTASDFDGDGRIDIAVTHFNATFVSVYMNTSASGAISFAPAVNFTCLNKGYNIVSQDLNGDGKAEIIVIHQPNPGPGSFSILRNTTGVDGLTFANAVNYPVTFNPQALAVADMNHDQKPDILIVGAGGSGNALKIFENKIASGPVITINPQPSPASVCDGATANFSLTASGTTNLTYQWQKFDGSTFNTITNTGGYSGTTTSTLAIVTTGNFGGGDYRCQVSGDNAADRFSNTVTLTINSVPAAPATTGDSDCVPASLTLTASGGTNGQYRWYDVNTSGASFAGQVNNTYATPVISTTTTYYAAINNGFCESARTAAVATIAPLAKPALVLSKPATGGTVNLCEGETLTLTAPAGFESYTWSTGEFTEEVSVDQPDVVSVIVEDAAGCTGSSDAVNVIVNPYPVAEIGFSGTTLTASPGDSYQWYHMNGVVDGATGQSLPISVLEYGEYTVDVTDNGCTTRSDIFYYFVTGEYPAQTGWKIYPNPFTHELFIQSPSGSNGEEVTIVDVMGRPVKKISSLPDGPLLLTDLADGTYELFIKTSGKTFCRRIVKTH